MRKRRVVRRIYGMKYSSKGLKDRCRHKNKIERSRQARLLYVFNINRNILHLPVRLITFSTGIFHSTASSRHWYVSQDSIDLLGLWYLWLASFTGLRIAKSIRDWCFTVLLRIVWLIINSWVYQDSVYCCLVNSAVVSMSVVWVVIDSWVYQDSVHCCLVNSAVVSMSVVWLVIDSWIYQDSVHCCLVNSAVVSMSVVWLIINSWVYQHSVHCCLVNSAVVSMSVVWLIIDSWRVCFAGLHLQPFDQWNSWLVCLARLHLAVWLMFDRWLVCFTRLHLLGMQRLPGRQYLWTCGTLHLYVQKFPRQRPNRSGEERRLLPRLPRHLVLERLTTTRALLELTEAYTGTVFSRNR